MTRRKKILIAVPLVLILGIGILIWGSYGFTRKSRFTHCLRDCYDLMLIESDKQLCPGRCTEIHKFNPTAQELDEIIAKIENKNTNTKKPSTNTTKTSNANSTNASSATNSAANTNINLADYQNRSYYCNWVWYQEIIDKDTKELIYECPGSQPWCYYADYTFEKVGCCVDAEHTDCTTLPNLLLNE